MVAINKQPKDVITCDGIKKYIDTGLKTRINIEYLKKIESTNDIVKKRATQGEKEGLLVIAGEQTAGKGRMDRNFFSPGDTGVYMSLLLRPQIKPSDAVLITTAAAVGVCKALNKMNVGNQGIKWVNDIYIDGKKACGILAEAGFDTKGKLDYIVLGVGLNMYEPKNGFPDDIRGIAGAVFSEKQEDMRNRFVGEFLNAFFGFYGNIADRSHVQEYKELCFLYNRDVDVINAGEIRRATVLGLDDNCGLQVMYDNGEKAVLTSGEVSLKVVR